jgi:hypothetical protein
MCLARLFVTRVRYTAISSPVWPAPEPHNHSFANPPVCLVPEFFIIHQSINLFISPPVCLVPVFIIHQSINLFISPPVCLVPVFFIVHQSINLFINPPVCSLLEFTLVCSALLVHQPTSLSMNQSTGPSSARPILNPSLLQPCLAVEPTINTTVHQSVQHQSSPPSYNTLIHNSYTPSALILMYQDPGYRNKDVLSGAGELEKMCFTNCKWDLLYHFRFVKGAMNVIDLAGIFPYFMSLTLSLITTPGGVSKHCGSADGILHTTYRSGRHCYYTVLTFSFSCFFLITTRGGIGILFW